MSALPVQTPANPPAAPPAVPLASRVLAVLWPAFLLAGVQEALVFVVVDPPALHGFGVTPIEWSAQAIYTITFLIFWITTSTAGALTQLLLSSEKPAKRGPKQLPPRWPA